MESQETFTFIPTQEVYKIQLKKKKFPWWIFLILILLLAFLIPVSDTINVTVVEKTSLKPLSESSVTIIYTEIKTNQLKTESKTTNNEGVTKFKVNRRMLFKYLFFKEKYNKSEFDIKATKENYNADSVIKITMLQIKSKEKEIKLQLEAKPEAVIPIEPQKPKEGCRAFFTGLVVGGKFDSRNISEVYKIDDFSEYVGSGEYPDNEIAFPKAVASTFDGIAIDKGTRVIIYAEKEFKGEILLDKTGPAIINNIKWKDDQRYSHCNTENYPEPLQSNFPQNVREWSKTDMHHWSFGSLKVICK